MRELAGKLQMRPFEMLRKKEPQVKELGLSEQTPDAEVIRAIAANPALLQRPIVEVGDRAVMARPAAKALDLLK